MADWKLQLYHRLPPVLRNLAASYRGWQLKRWRYGPETEQLVQQALERDRWSSEQWKTYQENRLSYILHRAATKVPYYRNQWFRRRQNGDRSSWEYLENWPILEKEPLRQNPEAFVAEDHDTSQMYALHTSGTSGTPLRLWWTQADARQWYAMFEARNRRWYDVKWHENWGMMGGQIVTPLMQQHPPFWIHNYPLNQLYLSTFHISAKTIKDYIIKLQQFDPTHIITYTSSAALMARLCEESGIEPNLSVKVIITNAEPLFKHQREVLARVFKTRVIETYGQAEAISAATEDPDGHLRFWPESGWLEVIDSNGGAVPAGATGDFIATHLFNDAMPLIRYRVGDRGAVADARPDSSHNGLPTLKHVEGRTNDMILTQDGREVFWLNPIFYGMPVAEAQIRQESLSEIQIVYVPQDNFTNQTKSTIKDRLQERVGDVDIIFQEVDIIPREKSGKFRAVISNLSDEERAKVQ